MRQYTYINKEGLCCPRSCGRRVHVGTSTFGLGLLMRELLPGDGVAMCISVIAVPFMFVGAMPRVCWCTGA